MSGHTPGPWEIHFNGLDRRYEVRGCHGAGRTVASKIQTREDADLVAAAPEMLESLNQAAHALIDGSDVLVVTRAMARISAAIAKARGEETKETT